MPPFLKPSLNWLLVFVPAAAALHYGAPERQTALFVICCIAIIPLAGWMGKATEHLAERTGEGVGGLLNATFGNAAELIIALVALKEGKIEIVKASLTGSIIGNILLVLGAAFLAGGLKFKSQNFNVAGARSNATMLTLAWIAFMGPTAFHYLLGDRALPSELPLSTWIAGVLLVTYALGLLFSLHTHKQLFSGHAAESSVTQHAVAKSWSVGKSLLVLLGATALVAWVSEMLVASVEHAAHELGMSNIFVGVIVVAVIGNAAEHSTAILVAMKNRMDLALGIAIGSSIQIALFVAPVLLFASYVLGPTPMNLVFEPAEALAVAMSVIIVGQIAGDGESNWLEGVQLLSVYIIIGIVFYFLPHDLHPN